ncbi:hypothetical protein SLEP1_g20433 [Rubroshorea leprosula]|uniref:Transposase n=1 Tax=Rubroshorea leprosula TaxID=152421 RepID=A0AAV5JD86_9ROSI|nr:hypothetical protein SLEP1_g20433 [Rubroshorea leprosula]
MRYLLTERGIINVYIEHVCDEPNILALLEGGTILHEAIDEGTMDIGEGYVTQNSQPTPNCTEALETVESEGDETDVMHGGDASQQQDPEKNDHDDEELPNIMHSDVDDEDCGEGCVTQNSHSARNFHETPETAAECDADEIDAVHEDGAGPSDTIHETPTTINEDGERVPIGTDGHGDLAYDSSFENSEDEFEVSSDDSGEYNVVDEDEPKEEEEEEDVRTTKSGDLWFNPSWTDVWFEIGIKFEHVAQFKEAIAKYQIQKGYRLKPIKSDPTRPIIGVDACFFKGMFKGTLLATVARVGNNQMFPIAWAVVDSEYSSS